MKQLRVIGLGDYANYYSYFTYGVLEGAVRCGVWFRPVHLFQQIDDVVRQIDFFKPHIIVAHCIFNRRPHKREDVFQILSDFKKRYDTKIFYHMGDARAEPRYPHDISDFVDCSLVNNLELNKWSGIWKVPCIHWPYMALYQKDICVVDERFKSDVVFTGSLGATEGHHADRTNLVEELKKSVKVKTYPDKTWGNTRFLTAEVSSSSGTVIGTQMGGNIFGYVDVRPWQYIGAGALYFHERHRNMNLYFREYEHFVPYGSVEELIEMIDYYKVNKKVGDAVRCCGFKFCQKHHSTKERFQRVIDFYNGIRDFDSLVLSRGEYEDF